MTKSILRLNTLLNERKQKNSSCKLLNKGEQRFIKGGDTFIQNARGSNRPD